MENCKQNHKRDFAIILSILFHVLLFLFLFYKIKEQFDESQPDQSQQNNNPIFLSQDLASNLEQIAPKSDELEKVEPQPEPEPIDLSTQIIPNLSEEAPTVRRSFNEDGLTNTDEAIAPKIEEDLEPEKAETEETEDSAQALRQAQDDRDFINEQNELAKELKKFEEFKEAEKLLDKPEIKPVRKRTRRKILASNEDMPTIPNVIDYMNTDLKTNLFEMVNDNKEVDIKYLSYHRKIMEMISMAFIALYSGKSLGVPKHEFDAMMRGVILDIAFTIIENGNLDNVTIISSAKEYSKCLERAIKYAAPFPKIPKHFNTKTHTIRVRENTGLARSGKGIISIYPT